MATTFLEPGGDATFNTGTVTNGGFWGAANGAPAIATDFVHGTHVKSIKYRTSNADVLATPAGIVADAGGRVSVYVYLNALPSAAADLFYLGNSGTLPRVDLRITSGGVLQLWNQQTAQIGSNGSTLSGGQWYRISLAYTITSTTVNRFEVFLNGVSTISVTNATLTATGTSTVAFGNAAANATLDFRSSDHYVDNSSSLTDTGDTWVTAKRPNANGTTNGFSTQIGAGGSGYGTGHSPQVNERALSTTNGWSMVGAGSTVTEEYNIESKSTGDIDISTATIIDWLGWVDIKSLVGETISVILNGATISQAITSTITLYTKIKGSTTYPSGTGADIGVITDTSLTTVSLYECGVLVAYKPAATTTSVSPLTILGAG